jgi:hypothetical protein
MNIHITAHNSIKTVGKFEYITICHISPERQVYEINIEVRIPPKKWQMIWAKFVAELKIEKPNNKPIKSIKKQT